MSVATLILSAGASFRMGFPKALLPTSTGATFLQQIAAIATQAGATPIVVVIGKPHGEQIQRAHPDLVAHFVENPKPEEGMLSSVQRGLAFLPTTPQGVLIWPVDIPYVLPSTLHRLVVPSAKPLRIPSYGGRGGHPLYVGAELFVDLLATPASLGLRWFRQQKEAQVEYLDVPFDPGILRDHDTPEDLVRDS